MNRISHAVLISSFAATPCAFAQGEMFGVTAQTTAQSSVQLAGVSLQASSEASSKGGSHAANATRDESPDTCETDKDCAAGMTCHRFPASGEQHCVGSSPRVEPASSSLIRRGSEMFLRDRVVQLREELALGRGPVITALASLRGESAVTLGRTLRTHRAELVALIGEGDWAGKFLSRVDLLCERTPT